MVAQSAVKAVSKASVPEPAGLPDEDLRWCSVNLYEVLDKGARLKGAVFDIPQSQCSIHTC